ncbi:hypothetical protein GEV33_004990 [Tenebrio molitor]|uniref:Uncharacterized protein n=1 Tax=Tenebrio molitor TaxID=7067 RepID=A0A8J6HMB5_TENMO|nr:hypothetical protein GEV33_004990 [Tenebrio molitor]
MGPRMDRIAVTTLLAVVCCGVMMVSAKNVETSARSKRTTTANCKNVEQFFQSRNVSMTALGKGKALLPPSDGPASGVPHDYSALSVLVLHGHPYLVGASPIARRPFYTEQAPMGTRFNFIKTDRAPSGLRPELWSIHTE